MEGGEERNRRICAWLNSHRYYSGRSSPPMAQGSVVSYTFIQWLSRRQAQRLTKDAKSDNP